MSDIERVIGNLRAGFNTGKTKPLAWRVAQLQGIIRFLKEKEANIIQALAKDLGRCKFESVALEVNGTLAEIEYIIHNLKDWMKPEYTRVPGVMAPAESEIQHEPFGCVLIMGAFNYPISLTLGPLVGAIAAGNVALIKPSELDPECEKLMQNELMQYIDNECFAVICGGIDVNTAILKQRFDKIFFTGSPRVGKIVMKAAAEHLTPVELELGGKSPTVIDESVTDLKLVCQRLLWGKCANAGQTCIAPDYVFCHEKHYDAFLKTCEETIKRFYGEDPQKADEFARIVSKMHCERLQALLPSKTKGTGKVVFGGRIDIEDRYMEPTLITDMAMDSKIMTEEIFGPLLPVIKFKDPSEVVQHVVATGEKPLALYIFGKNRKVNDYLISNISSGGVVVNDTLFQFGNIYVPFGGVGQSGMGGYHGKFSFECFSHRRTVMRRDDHMLLDVPVRYPPYNETSLTIFRTASKLPSLPPITRKQLIHWTVGAVAVGCAIAGAKLNGIL